MVTLVFFFLFFIVLFVCFLMVIISCSVLRNSFAGEVNFEFLNLLVIKTVIFLFMFFSRCCIG